MALPDFDALLASFPRPGDPLGYAGTWRESAVRAGFAPVFHDWTAGMGVDAEGEPFVSEDDDWTTATPVTNVRWRHIVLAQAAAHFPELARLRPVRVAGARTCPSCQGSGESLVAKDLICECGNLGWIPEGAL
jgi:hypothetical protein